MQGGCCWTASIVLSGCYVKIPACTVGGSVMSTFQTSSVIFNQITRICRSAVAVCVRVCVIPGFPSVFSLALTVTRTHTPVTDGLGCLSLPIPSRVCTHMPACSNAHTVRCGLRGCQVRSGNHYQVWRHISVVSVTPPCEMCFVKEMWRFITCRHVSSNFSQDVRQRTYNWTLSSPLTDMNILFKHD